MSRGWGYNPMKSYLVHSYQQVFESYYRLRAAMHSQCSQKIGRNDQFLLLVRNRLWPYPGSLHVVHPEQPMAFVDKYVAEFIQLEMAAFHARSRLEARTDPEALHDLRIVVRRLRSLLAPLKKMHEVAAMRGAAAEIGRLTTPARDLEVIIEELERRGYPTEAAARRVKLQTAYQDIVSDPRMDQLFVELDRLPALVRSLPAESGGVSLEQHIDSSLNKHVDKLHESLGDPQFDRHELRILVKRTRYLIDAFPTLSPLANKAAKSLKAVQSALGSWHDHHQWCLRSIDEPDLSPLEHSWAVASVEELEKAELELVNLADLLPKISRKKGH